MNYGLVVINREKNPPQGDNTNFSNSFEKLKATIHSLLTFTN